MSMAYEEYMRQLVQPMRDELVRAGFRELRTSEEVEQFMENVEGTILVVVNSVCGCAAGLARPAATQAVLNSEKKPDHLVTVFAGQDREATAKMREYFVGYAPSSPSMALLKGKEVVHFIPREEIEFQSMEAVMENIMKAFAKYCE
ncbi:BrxA/BrxB family bacilliredoxin [Parageobacillus thermoglucosidasius]|uniref:BrxA/BrxB family bacilliredoxin n=1 Tax=Parageobacillus thermoglucosidasius TaxID=1426 RepID=UPI000E193C78|nr:BrxA/BrxB family bacilliredoxin [Parageobacillus thermoglucosidasius]REK54165.1 MAG: BrxA/BrxB family bacilliredoxin [Geobacillus sp.]MED4904719.1 BrxA/BrxB family bacilliredoxin [Parageobacillus thermoglucosidasius]MED4913719.1 BrxA/BrxB family bacilliredoxin [Parageobacillus thermoglucosidasius]MED4944885.1 BrxA/BrxB family bacilliredoxin [Parageobacillus thermoglucosidasius]MED4982810.1 BrxA/BrxB family bacilliredoxin [Parageobacillus thermoglucosidasius]